MLRFRLQKSLILAFIGILMPAFVLLFGLEYYSGTINRLQENQLISNGEALAGQASDYVDNNRFWCQQMNQAIFASKDFTEFEKKIVALGEETKVKIAYLGWENDGSVHISENLKKYRKNFKRAGQVMISLFKDPGGPVDPYDELFMRRQFGPHFQARRLYESWRLNKPNLVETDFDYRHPLAWGGQNASFTALLFFPPSVLKQHQGLQFFKRRMDKELPVYCQFAILGRNKKVSSDKVDDSFLEKVRGQFLKEKNRSFSFAGKVVFIAGLEDGSTFILWQKKPSLHATRVALLFSISMIFVFSILIRRFSLQKALAEVRIKKLILVFVSISNLLPMIAMIFFLQQYLEQKRVALIEEMRDESVKFIQMFEKEFSNEIKRFPAKVRKIISENRNKLNSPKISINDAHVLWKQLKDLRQTFKIIASSTDMVITDQGLLLDGVFSNMRPLNPRRTPDRIDQVFVKIARAFLGFWNQIPVSQKDLTETELVTYVLFQRPVDESMHLLIEMYYRIGMFGFGTNLYPSFTDVISLKQNDHGDFFGLFEYRQEEGALDFLIDLTKERIGNHLGIKLVYSRGKYIQPDTIFPFKEIAPFNRIVNSLQNYPPISADIVTIDDQQWICSAFSSSVMKIDLIALFPLSEIEKKLALEKRDLSVLLILNVAVILAIALTLSGMLLYPIEQLERGTQAIRSKNFACRLPELGNDELGRMGKIFNEAIEDLEELSIARVVQQQFFPGEPIDCPPFVLFGKSVTLAELGGDYYDFFMVDENSFVAMIGDVAGHGVGSALIMAMAKAVTLNSRDCFNRPIEYINRLHRIIYESKNRRQKKIMTMQYVFIDKLQQKIVFSNAGGCNPFIVNAVSGRFEEVILPGPVLGAFKKAAYKETDIELRSGDVMVFYTDGIIEARNQVGDEIGYSGFKEILLKNYSPDPQVFYHRVFGEYLAFLGRASAQDDLTMLFLACNKNEK
ncbi:MAG: PP2C family protein-serine/threonine phosphatase [Candidatus Rifleibacteriota bacterium]